jgi:Tol biopolymer transport system component
MKILNLPLLICLTNILLSVSIHGLAQTSNLGIFEGHSDVGSVPKPGAASYNPQTHTYSLTGSGNSSDPDEGHYLWKRIKGDFILYTRSMQLGKNTNVGWMVRSNLDGKSAYVEAVSQSAGLTALQFRKTTGGKTEEARSKTTHADVIQLERKSNTYTMRVAKFGEPFMTEQVTDLALGEEVYVGLFVNSSAKNVPAQSSFRDVRLSVPASETLVAYREYLASNLELLDVETGNRQVIFNAPKSIQAPNWRPDGKTLLYNGDGLMYNFDLASRQPTVLNTGAVKNNNNDHVLSFDGTMLGLSSGVKELGGSIIYTVAASGGEPKQITPKGPSYLHGWSPDKKTLVFTGSRNNEFDIYSVPSEGGPEVRLTEAKGLDDGPEYTPDGKYIYFNSARTGTMQIWRMKPDGSQQEAITNGEFHDWFPHISPDGKWIIFLSFLKEEVQADQHPFYKHVYLRLLPISGAGKPKVIAYIYGGQGTINTPSWSPDSKRVAFISNTAESSISPPEK